MKSVSKAQGSGTVKPLGLEGGVTASVADRIFLLSERHPIAFIMATENAQERRK